MALQDDAASYQRDAQLNSCATGSLWGLKAEYTKGCSALKQTLGAHSDALHCGLLKLLDSLLVSYDLLFIPSQHVTRFL